MKQLNPPPNLYKADRHHTKPPRVKSSTHGHGIHPGGSQKDLPHIDSLLTLTTPGFGVGPRPALPSELTAPLSASHAYVTCAARS